MELDSAVKASRLLRFLARLVRDADRKVFLIRDGLPFTAPQAPRLGWPDARPRSRCIDLSGFCADLNPDDGINGELKSRFLRGSSKQIQCVVCAPLPVTV